MTNTNNEKTIIQQGHHLLFEEDFLHKYSVRIKFSDFKGLDCEDFKKIDNELKSIRQDFTKLMVTMNAIDRNYRLYQEDRYPVTYYSVNGNQALDEIGCQIEYLFAKYRAILDYLKSILKTILLPTLKGNDKTEYDEYGKGAKDKQDYKFEWMTKYIANNFSNECPVMNIEWFQNLKKTRNAIIHKGASCLVFADKERLVFNVYTSDGIQEDEEQIEWDDYYKIENGLVRYDRYWGLHFAKLIVFCNAVLEFVNTLGNMTNENEWLTKNLKLDELTEFVDAESGEKIPDVRKVPCNLLEKLIDE